MQVEVLGPCRVTSGADQGGRPVTLGVRKQRSLLAALALHRGRTVPVDTIVELLWGEHPPPGVVATLQTYVAGLRKALEPDRAPRAPATVVVTSGTGYALRLPPTDLDAARFADAVTAVHRRLGPTSSVTAPSRTDAGTLTAAVDELGTALGLWHGEPYADLADAEDARAERARLDELRLVALEDRALARIRLGQHATVAAELESLAAAHPLREHLWALAALALARSGRQADALALIQGVRTVLDDELGLEPGPELRSLQQAILTQDALAAPPAPEAVPVVPRTTAPPPAASPLEGAAAPAWPLVGRAPQLAEALTALEEALAGRTTFVALVGAPGIGKSRLAEEVAAAATSRGVRVLPGRCSQDDGAPPLWPWRTVLAAAGTVNGVGEVDGVDRTSSEDGSPFAVWEGIVDAVRRTAQDRPTLVVLDDLHWADVATLRVLRLLAESPRTVPLMVLCTWRASPPPEGALADAAEMLARAHARRIDLEGLTPDEVGRIVAGLGGAAGRPVPESAVAELTVRTGGNPFFVVEYARLAAERGDPALLVDAEPPAAVQEVLGRRLSRLPDATQEVLRPAAVLGRQFDLGTLCRVLGRSEEGVLDALDPALAADLVAEAGIDAFRFGHALVRDVVYGGLPASRRARWHARAAVAVAGRPGREVETARHWARSGPAHAAEAWRSGVAAAASVRALNAHETRVELLLGAVAAQAGDPAATWTERYETLLDLVDAYRWTNDWARLVPTVVEAIGLADAAGDVVRLARAATAPTVGAIGRSGPSGPLRSAVVDALQRCLELLPAGDGPERCRVLLSLANEQFEDTPPAEREAIVDEAHAMARRLDDWSLRLDANLVGFAATWRPGTAERRLAWAEEAVALATTLGAEQAQVVAATMRAVALGELGRADALWSAVRAAADLAERLHIPFGLLVLESTTLPWAAMASDVGRAAEQLASITALQERMALHEGDDAVGAAQLALLLWQGTPEPDGAADPGHEEPGHEDPVAAVVAELADADGPQLPLASTAAALLLRSGRPDAARRLLAEHPVRTDRDDPASLVNWGLAAEVALRLGDRALAADVLPRLAPYAEMMASWGSSFAIGPVAAFLALAAAALDEREAAAAHAEHALRLAQEWQLPRVTEWLTELRRHHAF
ncbi:AfsR/SARP family transcriptional regulator [Microlunatus flavus]|uniref:Transcriptional regulatory protein, C terminal n=1 Tax=Microlunatus flavus TaxID=1036181 RepID=A0A1H9AT19_9ACTN|nr:AfsR/SARP family transcriptional regulator [Microlunatus flavus]SEP79972.1 Transcriptional regulatory protein, C terminal [Microlunatus flavus]